ncbi:Zinc uptake regulation protein ZUR [Enhygromyxa salina]|uniref:Zinc uptake regulation protein ZUR n=1 Tax=Enhygromyxa salina TaxID=215803 RepID=A0A0C2A4V7_9BACT|nr:Fur family transcriptional regulator [Enhygromyxa salina]KIG18443.1 Zinc uptake regulation protein ZUR [Enhygromyxa salina]
MASRISKTKRREIVAELHEAGMRATPARIAVLDAVRQASAPLTHGELTRQLDGNGWDAATIYRNLVAITDANLIVRTDHGDRRWRFEDRARSASKTEHQHPHFLCTDCGSVSCLPEVEVRLPRAQGLPRSAAEGAFDVQLRGVCDSCSD